MLGVQSMPSLPKIFTSFSVQKGVPMAFVNVNIKFPKNDRDFSPLRFERGRDIFPTPIR